ncbi:TVP38/TMEM64 family protein [Conexibacter sp. DBS9H8]|uniref:TVP38/TMEM64 family protein n=1 Tax=Conexibacter sp. DBS9H8 TaxID=2937801 RepID=UPI002010848E|nr:VTT domain-containing protein [Conexibacter sp. DBS9H8]
MSVDARESDGGARAAVPGGDGPTGPEVYRGPRADAEATAQRRGRLIAGAVTVLLLGLAFALALAIPATQHALGLIADGNLGGLRRFIRHLGSGGIELLLGLMLGHAVLPYPTELLNTTAGYVYGFLPGLLLGLCGWTGCAALSYGIGVSLGGPLLRTLLGPRFVRLEQTVAVGGCTLMLSARLIPVVPFSLLGYVAGATRAPLWRLVWTSAVGYLPQTAAVTYLGSQARSLSLSNPLVWIAAAVMIGLLAGGHLWTRRHRAG